MKPYIIAELAQGFEGSPSQARLLVRAAARAGADAAKLQLVYADELATPDYEHYALFSQLEMSDEEWQALAELARSAGIALQLDIFGPRSLDLAQRVGAQAVKIHSTDMSNPGLLAAVAASAVPEVLLSAGGCSLAEVDEALGIIGDKPVVLLLGFQGYPTVREANQVRRVTHVAARYAKRPRTRIGFADHADPNDPLALAIPAAALGAGATVFEKHLTLAKALKLEDHEAALNPDEFAQFAQALRGTAEAIGAVDETDAFLGMHETEKVYRQKTRKHVVIANGVAAGATLKAQDVLLKRSTSKTPIYDARLAIGRRLKRALPAGAAVSASDLEDAS
jgi:N,N'-diacetyllegionaminate synthase